MAYQSHSFGKILFSPLHLFITLIAESSESCKSKSHTNLEIITEKQKRKDIEEINILNVVMWLQAHTYPKNQNGSPSRTVYVSHI